MVRVNHPQDLIQYVGRDPVVSGWRAIDHDAIDTFARLTGVTYWIHTDPEKESDLSCTPGNSIRWQRMHASVLR